MHFPQSNLVGNSYDMDWSSVWRMSELVGLADSTAFGFRDFRLDDEFPIWRSILTDYEYTWDSFGNWASYFRENWSISVIVSLLYVASIPFLQYVMRDRKAIDLKYALFLWNSVLAVFSIMGVVRILPTLLYGVYANGPTYFLCRNGLVSYGRGPVGLWSIAFALSKYAELIDTLFLILRKKPVPFLHWFHHATVLLLTIGTLMIYGPTGIVMLTVNYFVHAIMYTYYAIAAVGKPPRWGQIVTKLQIIQMVNGLAVAGGMYYVGKHVQNCEFNELNFYAIASIYMSYLVLFVQFYIRRYLRRDKKE
jgi:hypothetical protein